MALTPLMEQYLAVKRQYADAVVLFRLGDFYEVFFDDAVQVSSLLDLTLTARDGGGGKVPMCGVPYHAVQGYLARLVKAGKKVAICEQVEDPKLAKGLVKREVTRVVTPSTFIENDADPSSPLLLGLSRVEKQWGVASLEPNTGVLLFWQEPDATLADMLSRIAPTELVTTKEFANTPVILGYRESQPTTVVTQLDNWHAGEEESVANIKAFFQLDSLRALELEPASTSAVALVLKFLQGHLQTTLPHIALPRRVHAETAMALGPVVERSLELFRPSNPDSRGKALLDVIDDTLTPMGGRSLRTWLRNPLLSLTEIAARHDAVAEFVSAPDVLENVRAALSSFRDLERLAARFSCQVATPKDLAALRDSLTHLPALQSALGSTVSSLLVRHQQALAIDLSTLQSTLAHAIVDVPPLHCREGGVFANGYHQELDRLRSIATDAKQWLAELQARESARTGISSLKIAYNRVFGYYIEISNTHRAKVPPEYTRKQTLANAERFVTPELKEYEDQILHAEEHAITLEQELFAQLCALVLQQLRQIQAVATAIAEVDTLASFAWLAMRQQYVRPEMTEEAVLQIVGGRHPVAESLLGRGKFIANDITLDRSTHQLILLTAPNMSGKSVYLRQTALIALLAQIGSFAPATSARIGIVDRIFTRIGASDNLALGESTFAVEMIETAQILNYATPRSLLVLDEIGRGTSTSDGLSIARSIIEFLVDPKGPRPRTLFASHFHELTEPHSLLPGVENFTFAVREWKGEVIFLYKVIAGAADQSYGIHVAKLAGLPRSVVERAEEILKGLEEKGVDLIRPPRRRGGTRVSADPAQLGLFSRSS
ncbi:MAG: DNA mismatch repair protein MutS [Deltaproteobacteria bacterium]|nr:DNA mismatch repair protein MutS [Deltaproteobacteria bacterium]